MTRDERSTLGRALLATLYTAFPLEHRPSFKSVLRKFGEDAFEVDLPVTQRAKSPRAVDPRLVAAVNTLPARGMEFRVLHMEHLDVIMIKIDVLQVVEL